MNNIIFSCFTPLHLITAAYYAYKFQNVNKVLVWQDSTIGTVDISLYKPFFNKIIVIPTARNRLKKLLYMLINAGYLFDFSEIGKFLKKNKDNNIYCFFSDEEFSTNKQICKMKKGKNNILILIEEGVAIYREYVTTPPLKYLIPARIVGTKTVGYVGATEKIDIAIVRHPDMINQKRYDISRYIKQNDFVKDEGFIKQITMNLSEDLIRNKNSKKRILLLGDPYKELQVTEEEYINGLQSIIDVCSIKYDVYIKKHPREQITGYLKLKNAIVIDDNKYKGLSAEIVASLLHTETIITVVSSAAYNIYTSCQNAKIIYIYPIVKKKTDSITIFDKQTEEPNIYIVNEINELGHILDKPIKERPLFEKNNDEDINEFNRLLNNRHENDM